MPPKLLVGKEQANCDILFSQIPKFLKVRAMVEAEQQPKAKVTEILNCVYCLTLPTFYEMTVHKTKIEPAPKMKSQLCWQRQSTQWANKRCPCIRDKDTKNLLLICMQIHTSQYKDACTQIKNLFSFIIKLPLYLDGRSAVKFEASFDSLWQSKDKRIIIKLGCTGDNGQSDVAM